MAANALSPNCRSATGAVLNGHLTAKVCLVMEYVDGEHFATACIALVLVRRVALFRQTLDAVYYAHGRLIAHGDLKPSNILVDQDGRVRLLDFGIARLITDEAGGVELTGAVTSSFASPARLAGEPPTIADDIFALGRVLMAIMTIEGDADLAAIAAKASAAAEVDRYSSVRQRFSPIWNAGNVASR